MVTNDLKCVIMHVEEIYHWFWYILDDDRKDEMTYITIVLLKGVNIKNLSIRKCCGFFTEISYTIWKRQMEVLFKTPVNTSKMRSHQGKGGNSVSIENYVFLDDPPIYPRYILRKTITWQICAYVKSARSNVLVRLGAFSYWEGVVYFWIYRSQPL